MWSERHARISMCGARTCYRVHAIELSTDAKRNSLSFPFEATRRFRLRRKPRYYLASQRVPVVTSSNRILACARCARIAHGRRAFSNKEQSVIVIDCLRERALRSKFPLLWRRRAASTVRIASGIHISLFSKYEMFNWLKNLDTIKHTSLFVFLV